MAKDHWRVVVTDHEGRLYESEVLAEGLEAAVRDFLARVNLAGSPVRTAWFSQGHDDSDLGPTTAPVVVDLTGPLDDAQRDVGESQVLKGLS